MLSIFERCSDCPATLLPYPPSSSTTVNLGQWLCVPPFQAVCLFQAFIFVYDDFVSIFFLILKLVFGVIRVHLRSSVSP